MAHPVYCPKPAIYHFPPPDLKPYRYSASVANASVTGRVEWDVPYHTGRGLAILVVQRASAV